jgi:hypothetical protein
MPQLYWIIPLEGGHVSNELPGGQRPTDPGYGRPIYHPGHPSHGLPSSPGHPANRPPGSGWGSGQIDNTLPEGEPVPPDTINPPLPDYLPEPYDDKIIVAVKRPGVTEWRVTAYDPNSGIDNALPPAPEPK